MIGLRFGFRQFLAMGALCAPTVVLVAAGDLRAEPTGRVAIVADEQAPMKTLADALDRHGIKATLFDQATFRELDASTVDAVFMYVHKPLRDGVSQALIRYALAGGRMIVLHHGIASAKMKNPKWLSFLGIRINPRNHETRPWLVYSHARHTVINLRPGHYVTSHSVRYAESISLDFIDRKDRSTSALQFDPSLFSPWVGSKKDFPSFALDDTEVFANQEFTSEADHTVLLAVTLRDPVTGRTALQPSGWFTKAGKGMLFYFQPGHQSSDFQHESFVQILINAVRWQPD